MKRSELSAGMKVLFSGTAARVLAVEKNGVKIGYWGRGLKDGQYIEERVSATYLAPAPKAVA